MPRSPIFPLHPSPIHTPRLTLRPLTPSHYEHVWGMRSDPVLMRWSRRRIPDTPEMVHERFDKWTNLETETPSDRWTFAIREKGVTEGESDGEGNKEGKFVGMIGLAGTEPLPEVGYMLRKELWGRGYASEALGAWMRAFWELPLAEEEEKSLGDVKMVIGEEQSEEYEVSAGTEAVNVGSNRVLEKNGFVVVGPRSDPAMESIELLDWRAKRPAAKGDHKMK